MIDTNDVIASLSHTMRDVLPAFLFEKSVTPIFASSAFFVTAYMLSLWGLNFLVHDPTFVDAAWSVGFIGIAFIGLIYSNLGPRSTLLFLLTTLWGLRLSIYLFRRWRQHGPDQRYTRLLTRLGGNYHLSSLIGGELANPLATKYYNQYTASTPATASSASTSSVSASSASTKPVTVSTN